MHNQNYVLVIYGRYLNLFNPELFADKFKILDFHDEKVDENGFMAGHS